MAIRYLPPVPIKGHQSSGAGSPEHPMRIATRRAAGLEGEGWNDELREDVTKYFDELAGEWHTHTSPERAAIVADALSRGLLALHAPRKLAVELGSGTGAYSGVLAHAFDTVIGVDISMEMLARAPNGPAHRVQADGAHLPLCDGSVSAVVLINAFLFPDEVARVLSSRGVIVWVSSSGEQTPIYLSIDDLVARLPGTWHGVASRAGEGNWCVLQRRATRRS